MILKIKKIDSTDKLKPLLGLLAVTVVIVNVLFINTQLVFANSQNIVCQGIAETTGTSCSAGSANNPVNNVAQNIVTSLSYAIGVVALIVILISGFNFITSSGNSTKIESAKKQLFYAIIGLALAAVAQIVVRLIFNSSASII